MLFYFIVTCIILALCFLGLAIGMILNRKPLQGSCGGLSASLGEKCEFCENKGQCQKPK